MIRLEMWWHRLKDHQQVTRRVSVPMWDPGAKGLLHRCSCGKAWAQ